MRSFNSITVYYVQYLCIQISKYKLYKKYIHLFRARKNNNKIINNLICMESQQKQNPILILIEFSIKYGLIFIYIT